HLYLIDTKTGDSKQITKGEYVVRGIDRIDAAKRQVWFQASGKNADQDPYLIHFYRVNFDGTELVALTEGNGTHSVQFSPDRRYIVDTYSRVDMPPVHELRRTSDGKLVCELEKADVSGLRIQPTEVFSAKGRDGVTDIWGTISRPKNFDPAKKYPVIEYIYAGPHGSHVPKRYSPFERFTTLTDLGFIVVQIDGMGTANRSKKFHDVCWKNLKDAGFPDRIAWHKAAAAKYPYYDATRVGIYGTSAGGQNATGALLFHGDFYKAAVSACGCHDNRMDKASWNEQWMGYPVGPHYAASSNIDNAAKLTGKLLLIVGEMDTNVPPESTYRLAGALIKANKDFDFVMVPGMGHSDGGTYGRRRLHDFFVRHLQGKEPPNRNVAVNDDPVGRVEALRKPDAASPTTEVLPPRGAVGSAPSLDPTYVGHQPEPPAIAPPPRPALDLAFLVARPKSEAGVVTRRYDVDRGNLARTHAVPLSTARDARFKKFHADWLAALKAIDQEKLSTAAREELLTLRSRIESEVKELETRANEAAAVAPLLPFAESIIGLEEARRRMETLDAQKAAGEVAALLKKIDAAKKDFETGVTEGKFNTDLPANKGSAAKIADSAESLRAALKTWYTFYDGYDPMFTWWVATPHKQVDSALDAYAKLVRDKAKKLPAETKFAGPVKPIKPSAGPPDAPDLTVLMALPQSELQAVIRQYTSGFNGRGGGRQAPTWSDPKRFLEAMNRIPFDDLSPTAKADYVMLRNRVETDLKRAGLNAKKIARPPVPKDDTGIVGRPIGREALMV
ncbi:MAG TPA: prolyl oligopeptidase family serine peptidase, partial [Gemmataceae bacterium]|nr:prolyl oligopeptidase family serine peptidase [Gemmataceae bacterium]